MNISKGKILAAIDALIIANRPSQDLRTIMEGICLGKYDVSPSENLCQSCCIVTRKCPQTGANVDEGNWNNGMMCHNKPWYKTKGATKRGS